MNNNSCRDDLLGCLMMFTVYTLPLVIFCYDPLVRHIPFLKSIAKHLVHSNVMARISHIDQWYSPPYLRSYLIITTYHELVVSKPAVLTDGRFEERVAGCRKCNTVKYITDAAADYSGS